eukprot:3100775-Rhodomonas_salina.3
MYSSWYACGPISGCVASPVHFATSHALYGRYAFCPDDAMQCAVLRKVILLPAYACGMRCAVLTIGYGATRYECYAMCGTEHRLWCYAMRGTDHRLWCHADWTWLGLAGLSGTRVRYCRIAYAAIDHACYAVSGTDLARVLVPTEI